MKTERKGILIIAVLALVMVIPCIPVTGQDKPADNMQILREKLKADKKLIVADAMELTESEAKAFWPVYESYQKELAKLNDRTMALIKDYAGRYQSMSNPVAKKMIDEFMAIQSAYQQLKVSYLPRFRQVLSDVKVARYYQVENKIAAVVNYELAAVIPLAK